jgi:hypothetical protein
MPARWAALLVGCLAAPIAGAKDCPAEGFAHWLCQLQVEVPPLKLTASGFDISIDGLTCTGLHIGVLRTNASATATAANFSGTIKGALIECNAGSFSVRGVDFPHLSGHGTADITIAGASLAVAATVEEQCNNADIFRLEGGKIKRRVAV